MTHTGGFEEESNDNIITDPKQAVTLREFLIANQPRRIFPPGVIPAYSNYGVGLGSYIVQRISGEPFEQYTDRHIYTPLKMTHSTFYQPLPKALQASEGYGGSTETPAIGFEYLIQSALAASHQQRLTWAASGRCCSTAASWTERAS